MHLVPHSPNPQNYVRIFIGAGMSFEVDRAVYEEALLMATLSRRLWFVGLKDNNGYEIGPSRQMLLEAGCKAIAWISPLNTPMGGE